MKQIISFALILALITPTLSEAAGVNFQFNRNLKKGDTVDPDVKYLQQVLNSKPDTRVAETGSGSNQQLSAYFGVKTKDAVIRFQTLYKSDILDPAGLTVANGAVGPLTRKKLNEKLGQLSATELVYVPYGTKGDTANAVSTNRVLDGNSTGSVTTTLFPAPITQKSASNNLPDGYIQITSLSSYKAVPGQVVSVFGQGFADESNVVYVGGINVGAFYAQDKATRITFTVPKVAKSGLYQIAIDNYFGTINSGNITLAIESDIPQVSTTADTSSTIVNNGQTALTGVSPKTSKNVNDVITLSGFNFTSQNTIQTNLGNFSASSEDGKTIQFLAGSLPFYQKALDLYKGKSVNVLIRVNNENGLSEQVTHVLQLPNSSNPTINSSSQGVDTSLANNTATSSSSYTTYNPYASSTITAQGNTQADNSLANYVNSFGNTNNNQNANQNQQQTTASSSSSSGSAAALAAGVALGVGAGAAAGLVAAPFFGGKIISVLPCTCTGSLLLTIFDYSQKRPMYLMYLPGVSSIKANYNLTPGASTMGGFTRATSMCWMAGPTVCTLYSYAEGTVDFIRGIGTSGV
jgi:hypothetical protein